MRDINRTSKFKSDYKRELRTDPKLSELLRPILESLVRDAPLAEKHRDHALGHNWKGYRDCHIKPDLLLIYKIQDETLFLARLGSHAELFG